jgi:replicative DNA helicase
MQNLAINWALAGLSGVYVTLELSEGLCAMRLDSMVTDVPSKDIFKDLDTVEMKIGMTAKKAGRLRIKYMPAQSNINDMRAYLKELQIQTGKPIDFICVDYLDLLMPVSAKVSPNDQFIKDKYVSEELRNLSKEFNLIMVTASQLNRAAVEEIEFDHSHISGGLSKIQTADNVIGIFTSRAMKERGRYQIQFMKTRSSSGVGQKVDLEFDVDSLRIRDLAEDEQQSWQSTGSSIVNGIKKQSTVTESNHDAGQETALREPGEGDTIGKISGKAQSSKLREMLQNINVDSD